MSESNDVNSVLIKIQSLYSPVESERIEAEAWLRKFSTQEGMRINFSSILSLYHVVVKYQQILFSF